MSELKQDRKQKAQVQKELEVRNDLVGRALDTDWGK